MAYQNNLRNVTAEASVDLSTHQFKVVELNTSGQALLAAAQQGYGILQNIPQANEAATTTVEGEAKAIAGGAVTTDDWVRVGSGGWLITVASGAAHPAQFVLFGRALSTAASGDLFTVGIEKSIIAGINSGDAISF